MLISLRENMESADGWGHEQGREVQDRLLALVERHPSERVFQVSLAGVTRTDASFPRESVVVLAKRFRGERGFCLVDITDPDLLENWDAAARRLQQPLTVWSNEPRVLGPEPSEGTRAVLDYILGVPETTASEVAQRFDLKIANASNKLKQLFEAGFVLRSERTAASGGIEHGYMRIR